MDFATLWVEICRYHDAILCKYFFEGCFILKIFDFLPFSVLKLHFQHLIFAKIEYNEFSVTNNWIFATLWAEICRYLDTMLCKNTFEGCFIFKIFDFPPFSVLKLHFQHLIFAEIEYNEFLSLIIGFLQPYEQKFVDILILCSVKIILKDVSSLKSLIFHRFPC